MYRSFVFLGGAFCVIAAMSLFRLHLIESQYAAAALGIQDTGGSVHFIPSYISPHTKTGTNALFPTTNTKDSLSSEEVSEKTHEKESVQTEPQKTLTIVVPEMTDVATLNSQVRPAIVNISCTSPGSSSPASGSGVIIDPRGIILTNAHVAQYVLLSESLGYSLDCTIRSGSPAIAKYRASVIYMSSRWVRDHADEITQESPVGTGENDYALLHIKSSINGSPLPSSFPYVLPDTRETAQVAGQDVLIASYPAGFLGGVSAIFDLNLVTTITTIKELFTFSVAGTADLIDLGGVISAQSGSSGGAVVDGVGHLLAIIATSSYAEQTSNRDLRAVTLFHINKSMLEETGKSLFEYTSGNLELTQAAFDTNILPELQKQFKEALSAK